MLRREPQQFSVQGHGGNSRLAADGRGSIPSAAAAIIRGHLRLYFADTCGSILRTPAVGSILWTAAAAAIGGQARRSSAAGSGC
jgi:hypothetical protein